MSIADCCHNHWPQSMLVLLLCRALVGHLALALHVLNLGLRVSVVGQQVGGHGAGEEGFSVVGPALL
eukprot:4239681-Lingulodinium_polyedra.AAC.1